MARTRTASSACSARGLAVGRRAARDLDRRFTLAAGLLELADQEFSAIRERLRPPVVHPAPSPPEPDDPRLDARELAAFLAGQYDDAGWSRTDHYAWISGLLLELGITSLDELGHQEDAVFELSDVVHRDDVGVRDLGHHLCLDQQLCPGRGRADLVGLERDLSVEFGIGRLVDDAHAAASEDLVDHVAPDRGPRWKGALRRGRMGTRLRVVQDGLGNPCIFVRL